MQSKIKKISEIKKLSRRLKKQKNKIVFTNGCFDILHYGHIQYLKKCKSMGDKLIVGLNSDKSIRKIKGHGRPIKKQKERQSLLEALEFVDYVVVFNETTPARLIELVTPDVLAKGGDWKIQNIVGYAHVKKKSGKIYSIPFVKGYSTTETIKKIKRLK